MIKASQGTGPIRLPCAKLQCTLRFLSKEIGGVGGDGGGVYKIIQHISKPSALSKLQISHWKESILAGREYGCMGERLHIL